MTSIIIPTFNAASSLPALLMSLDHQTIRPNELFVIDSSSEDNTVAIAREYGAEVISIQKCEFDHGGTRSRVTKETSGDILVFLTQDVVLDGLDSLAKLMEPLERDSEVAVVYGRQLPSPGATLFAQHLRYFNYPKNSHVREYSERFEFGLKTAFLSNSFAAYRRKDLESIGYFKSGLIFGEDMYASARLLKAGKKIAYNADSKVYHSHNYRISQEFCRYFDMGVFHASEKELLEEFGMASKEGLNYLKSEIYFLLSYQKYHLLFISFFRNFVKYVGYKLGKKFKLFPNWLNRRMSMNHLWWERSS